ncbi:MAG: sugar phosphate nucleotidyltransferase, partial [Acidobacteriota bacterium]
MRIRALVLTAGFGTRLRPLSATLPKPLLPIGGDTVAGWTLRRLAAAGCEAALLNLHHLGDQVVAHFGASHWGLPLDYSYEKPEILGTFGALYPTREFLADSDAVVLINGDA